MRVKCYIEEYYTLKGLCARFRVIDNDKRFCLCHTSKMKVLRILSEAKRLCGEAILDKNSGSYVEFEGREIIDDSDDVNLIISNYAIIKGDKKWLNQNIV